MCQFNKQAFKFVILLLFVSTIVVGQNNTAITNTVITHNGKLSYEHIVEKGQTLYSISKKYNVEISVIESFNDGLKDGLKLGSTIYIPINSQQLTHVVQAGQTLYSIAKLYNIDKNKIIKDNKLLDENLKIDQSLIINFDSKSVIETTNKASSNSIDYNPKQLEGIKAEIQNSKIEEVSANNKLIVALLLPLYLEKNFPIEEGATEEGVEEKVYPVYNKSIAALEFYEGVKLALDTILTDKTIELVVLDCPNDTSSVQNILQNKDLKKAQIIIGPFNSNYAPIVAEYCKKNKKIYCTPFGLQGKILLNNAYAFKASASNTTQLEHVANYLRAGNKNSQCIIIHNGLKKEKNLVDAFKLRYNSTGTDSAKEILFKDSKLVGLKSKLSTSKLNNIVVTSNDQAFVTDFINKISSIKNDYNFHVFGTDQWQDYENLEVEKLQELNIHIPSNYYINYDDSITKIFVKKFRSEYNVEPSRAAFLGYDLMCMIISNTQNEISIDSICNNKFKGLHIAFDFIKTSHESGFENRFTTILKYDDYLLRKVAE